MAARLALAIATYTSRTDRFVAGRPTREPYGLGAPRAFESFPKCGIWPIFFGDIPPFFLRWTIYSHTFQTSCEAGQQPLSATLRRLRSENWRNSITEMMNRISVQLPARVKLQDVFLLLDERLRAKSRLGTARDEAYFFQELNRSAKARIFRSVRNTCSQHNKHATSQTRWQNCRNLERRTKAREAVNARAVVLLPVFVKTRMSLDSIDTANAFNSDGPGHNQGHPLLPDKPRDFAPINSPSSGGRGYVRFFPPR